MTASMWYASVCWVLIVLGYARRTQRNLHVPLVLSGLLGDIALVLFLQFTRDAIGTALAFKLSFWNQIHIGFSSIALVLYFPVLYFGIELLRGNEKCRSLHHKFATTALLFRTLGFIFMFSMWKN